MPGIGLKRGIVKLVSYNKSWPKHFEEEKEKLENVFGEFALSIEHVGSTAIPNIKAKPIIDILIGGVGEPEEVYGFLEKLKETGYEYSIKGSNKNKQMFAKGPESNRTHYLHVTKLNSDTYKNDICFRDCLRGDREIALEYETLKVNLAKKYTNDRKSYTEGKEKFIESVLKKFCSS